MLDVEKNIAHWRDGAMESLEAAEDLIKLIPSPSLEEARHYLQRAKGAFEWLTDLF